MNQERFKIQSQNKFARFRSKKKMENPGNVHDRAIFVTFALFSFLGVVTSLSLSHSSSSLMMKHPLKFDEPKEILLTNTLGKLHQTNCKRLPGRSKSSTSLSMGLRSFLRRRLGTEEGDGKDDSTVPNRPPPEDVRAALEAIKSDLEAVVDGNKNESQKNGVSKFNSDDGNSASEKVPLPSASLGTETISERINRMKSGMMTDEEKAAFLDRALVTPIRSQEKKPNPIRQKIPEGSAESSGTEAKASAFPSDSLWGMLEAGKRGKSQNSEPTSTFDPTQFLSSGGTNEKAKREYLDMVFDPNRFKGYSAMGDAKTSTVTVNSDDEADEKEVMDEDVIDEEESTEDEPVMKTSKEEEALSNSNVGSNLAARLEHAATLKEQQDKQREIERKKRMEKEQKEEKERIEKMRLKQMEESRRQMEEAAEKKRLEAEAIRLEQQAKKLEEDAKMKQLMDSQQAYWEKKLEEERKRKEAKMKNSKVENKEEKKNIVDVKQKVIESVVDAPIDSKNEESVEPDVPESTNISKTVKDESPEENDSNVSRIWPLNDKKTNTSYGSTTSSFVEEQEKKRQELDKILQLQREQLKSLNSPLPSPTKAAVSNTKPVIKTSSATRIPTTPNLSLSELTMKSKPKPEPADNIQEIATPTPSPTARLSLTQMTMLKRDDDKPKVDTKSVKQEAKPTPAPRRIVRQKVPLPGANEDDDFMEYARGSENAKMSIKDIMAKQNSDKSDSGGKKNAKNKSKMWGIDMDKLF